MQFNVVKGNIVNVTADAIVLPANKQLKEGSGTSRAIFEAAGRKELTQACKEIGHWDVGSAVPTLAYNLNPTEFIIHAVVPRWVDGESNEYGLLSSAYLSALNTADALGCNSIAFPLLASGNNGFDKKLAVQIAEESIGHFSGTSLKEVILVVYGDNMEVLMKSLGYTVATIPKQTLANRQKSRWNDKAQKVMRDQIEKVIEWLRDPKNRELLFQYGTEIAVIVLGSKIPQVAQILRIIGDGQARLPNAPEIPVLEGEILEEG